MAESDTHELIARLQDEGEREEALKEFATKWGTKILNCARHMLGNDADAQDVSQEVCVEIWKQFKGGWTYDPNESFKAWLRTITQNKARDAIRKLRAKPGGVGGTTNLSILNDIEFGDRVADSLNDEFERECLARAEAQVKSECNPKHWELYEKRKDGSSFEEIARQTSANRDSVKTAYFRIERLVKAAARVLAGGDLVDDGVDNGEPKQTRE